MTTEATRRGPNRGPCRAWAKTAKEPAKDRTHGKPKPSAAMIHHFPTGRRPDHFELPNGRSEERGHPSCRSDNDLSQVDAAARPPCCGSPATPPDTTWTPPGHTPSKVRVAASRSSTLRCLEGSPPKPYPIDPPAPIQESQGMMTVAVIFNVLNTNFSPNSTPKTVGFWPFTLSYGTLPWASGLLPFHQISRIFRDECDDLSVAQLVTL